MPNSLLIVLSSDLALGRLLHYYIHEYGLASSILMTFGKTSGQRNKGKRRKKERKRKSSIPKRNTRSIVDTHVVRTLHILVDITAACTSESFNGKIFAFLHLGLVATLDNRDGFASVDLVRINRVSVQVTNWLDCMIRTLSWEKRR